MAGPISCGGVLVTGDNALWWMSGGSQMGGASFTPAEVAVLADMNWEIRAVGDFNNDGKPDLLWQNLSTGDLAVWCFNNQQRITTAWLSLLSGTHAEWPDRAPPDLPRSSH